MTETIQQLEDLKNLKKEFSKILADMVLFYEMTGHEVYSLHNLEEEIGFCYNCRENNFTCLFVLTSIGGPASFEYTNRIEYTKLAVIFLLCPVCAQKYEEDSSITIKVIEAFNRLHLKSLQDAWYLGSGRDVTS